MRPLIGIPCHADYRHGSQRPVYCNNRAYTHAVESAGGLPILIPILKDHTALDRLLSRLDGLLLSGGGDIHPARYGEERHPLSEEPDETLDEFELKLIDWALQEDVPTLGVCRGMQLMNVALGGSLHQDIVDQYATDTRHSNRDKSRDYLAHTVKVLPGTRMEAILRAREVRVNSLHHQAVKQPGKGVTISGVAEDGIAEMMEVADYRFMLAVQFHPEEIYTREPGSARLFSAFVQACSPTLEEHPALVYVPTISHELESVR